MIDKVNLKNMVVHLPKSSNSDSSIHLSSIHLPINLYIKQVLLDNITIYNKKNNYVINKIHLTADVVNDVIMLHQFSVLTPYFSTSSQGKININNWSSINFNNTLTANSRPEISILTNISGDKDILSLNIKSVKWLNINLIIKNYLQRADTITLKSDWFVDTTQADFPELKKLNGKLQLSGHANGRLLQPTIDGKLLVQNLRYETTSIQKLNSTFNFTFDDRQNLTFELSGKNISFGETLLNNLHASILGTLKSHKIKVTLQMLDSYFFSFSTQAGLTNKNSYFFKQGMLDIAPLNLILKPISLTIDLEKNKSMAYEVTMKHNHETLLLQGNAHMNFPNLEAKLSLSTSRFTIINTDFYRILIGSDLKIIYNNEATKINGNLQVINATIKPADFSNTVMLTSDIIYVNNQNQPLYQKSTPLKLFMDVMVKIKQLSIDYKGIQADITGETKLTQTPTTELNAYGQLQLLKGSYKAYGQMLTIQKGSVLNFNREIDNPQLNITASKEIKVSSEYMTLPSYQPYLIAGVQVTGTADEPNIHLFSIPSGVSQQDILSYLIFGFPQNQLSKSQASALWSAFSMMDTGTSNFSITGLQKNIQNEFGFSEFGIGSTSEYNAETQQYDSGTAFVVAKHITDNLTATYNVGILVPVNVLYLRYQLSQRWALQSDSSALGNGGDILYTIRRD